MNQAIVRSGHQVLSTAPELRVVTLSEAKGFKLEAES